jgi:hypothetical protein
VPSNGEDAFDVNPRLIAIVARVRLHGRSPPHFDDEFVAREARRSLARVIGSVRRGHDPPDRRCENKGGSEMTAINQPFVSAPDVSVGGLLLDRVVALRPILEDVVDTKLGPSAATVTHVLEIEGDGTYIDHGEIPLFWSLVRRQLAHATPEQPWVVGVLTRSGAAYRLEQLNELQTTAVTKALTAYEQS